MEQSKIIDTLETYHVRRGVAVDDIVGEEAPAGWRTEQGVGFRRGFSRPRCTNGWANGMGVGNH